MLPEPWTGRLNSPPLDLEKHAFSWISNSYVNLNETVVVSWRKKYHKTWCCEWQVWPVHSLTMAIGVTYKAIRLMVSLVLEEVTLKSWRGINFENTAREYKRWSEISPEERQWQWQREQQWQRQRERQLQRELQLRLGFRDGRHGFRSDGSDLGTHQASYGLALGLAKAQHVEQKPCTDSRSESGSASST